MSDKYQLIYDILKGKDTLNPALLTSTSNSKKLSSSIDDIGKGILGAGRSIYSFAASFTGLGAVAAGIAGTLTFGKAISEAIEGENAINKLNSAMESAGRFSKKASDDLQSFAESIQQTTKYSDDQVLSSLALMESLTSLDANGLKRAQKSALDLSSALGIDLETATTLVAKAAEGNISTFQRYGIEIKKGKDDAETFANTLGVLESRFSGRAQADVKTFSGAIALLGNNFNNLLETFGKSIIKNETLIVLINEVTKAINDYNKEVETTTGKRSDVFSDLIKSIVDATVYITSFVDVTVRSIEGAANFIVYGVSKIIEKGILMPLRVVENAFLGLVNKMASVIGSDIKFASMIKPLEDQFAAFGEVTAEAFSESFQGGKIEKFGVVLAGISDKLEATNGLIDDVNRKTGGKQPAKDEAQKVSKEFATPFLDAMAKIFKGQIFTDNAKAVFERIGNAFPQSIRNTFEKIGDMLPAKFSKQTLKAFDQIFSNMGNFISKGKEGAKALGVMIGSKLVDTVAPGMGEAVKPFIEMFAMGPEQTRKMVAEFMQSIPEILSNIIDSVPVFIDEFIRQLPYTMEQVVRVLSEKLSSPYFATNLSIVFTKAMIEAAPKMAPSIAEGFYKGIMEGFEKAFKDLAGLWKNIFKFDGGGKGPVENFLNFDFPFIAFARGGKVPGRAVFGGDSPANDTIPAMLSAGEVVLPRSAVNNGTEGIFKFLKDEGVIKGHFLGIDLGPIGDFFGDFFNRMGMSYQDWMNTAEGLLAQPFVPEQYKEDFNKLLGQIGPFRLPEELLEVYKSLIKLGARIDIDEFIKNPLQIAQNAVRSIVDIFKPNFKKILSRPFANGGIVPDGFPSDSFPARLSSGEAVIKQSTTKKLDDFLNGEAITSMLGQILIELKKPQTASAQLNFNNRVLADIILDLNRSNARMA